MTQQGRNWLIGIVVLLIIIAGVWAFQASNNSNSSAADSQQSRSGRAVIAVTDAAADLQNIQSVMVTIDKVEVQSTNQGWITVSDTLQQFDLLSLKQSGTLALLADADLPADTYNIIRLNISKVMVAASGQAAVEAKLPSSKLELVGKLVVKADQTSTLVVDFILDKSLHVTGNGKFILTPVVKLTSESSANVTIQSNNQVKINSGTTEDSRSLGMDIDGSVKANFEVDKNLDLIGNTIHATLPSQSEAGVKITASKAVDLAKASGKIDTAVSVQLNIQSGKKVWQIKGLLNLLPVQVFIDATTGVVVTTQ